MGNTEFTSAVCSRSEGYYGGAESDLSGGVGVGGHCGTLHFLCFGMSRGAVYFPFGLSVYSETLRQAGATLEICA